MLHFEVWDEVELISGFICKFSSKLSKEKGSDVIQRINNAVKLLQNEYFLIFWDYVNNKFHESIGKTRLEMTEKEFIQKVYKSIDSLDERQKQLAMMKASVWYQVCYNEKEYYMLSFAWIASSCLCMLKANSFL
jgi:hypothetical protein